MLGPSLALLMAILAAVSTAQEEDASPKYHVCPTDDNPEPYCCTNLVAGVGFGCRPRKCSPTPDTLSPTVISSPASTRHSRTAYHNHQKIYDSNAKDLT